MISRSHGRALCERQARCCFDSPDVDLDVENCAQTAADGYCRWLQQLRADDDARAADGCVSAYRPSCSEVEDRVQEACAHVFTGQQALRAECTTTKSARPQTDRSRDAEVTVSVLDMRVQQVALAGQELMTHDKVTLRLTLTVECAIDDPSAVAHSVLDVRGCVLLVRAVGSGEYVASVTRDELLEGRDAHGRVHR